MKENEPPIECQSEPITDLPLRGYYGGKPKRFTVEFDDTSAIYVGNADGSVDLIVEKLQRLYMGDASTCKDEGLGSQLPPVTSPAHTDQPDKRRTENGGLTETEY